MTLKGVHPRTIHWLDTLPSTGRLMRNLRCHHVYTKGWNFSSTRTNPSLVRSIDTWPNQDATLYVFAPYPKSPAALLYCAALRGFHDLVEHLITKHPQDVNADGGFYVRPLVAALTGEHIQTADLLRHNGIRRYKCAESVLHDPAAVGLV